MITLIQIKSLLAFARSAIRNGFDIAEQSDMANRMIICAKCPMLKSAGKKITCGVCGCPIRSRTLPAASFCPDNPQRWDVVKGRGKTRSFLYLLALRFKNMNKG